MGDQNLELNQNIASDESFGPEIYEVRAKIARKLVSDQTKRSAAKIPDFGLDPTKDEAPGFKDIKWEELKALSHVWPPTSPHKPVDFKIGVIGGGMAGLYTSLMLQHLRLDHEVLEASSRPGGRTRTHYFSKEPGDYCDLGARNFPNNPTMARTFRLLEYLGVEKDTSEDPEQGCLIPSGNERDTSNNPLYFNRILKTRGEVRKTNNNDPFNVSTKNGGFVPNMYVPSYNGYSKLLAAVFDDWKKGLANPKTFEKTLADLMILDRQLPSLRSVLFRSLADKNPEFTGAELYYVTHWCETWTSGTSHFDQSFFAWLLLALEFSFPRLALGTFIHDPHPIPPIAMRAGAQENIETREETTAQGDNDPYLWIMNGGTELIAHKTVEKLNKKPLYNRRVTAIAFNPFHDRPQDFYTPLDPAHQPGSLAPSNALNGLKGNYNPLDPTNPLNPLNPLDPHNPDFKKRPMAVAMEVLKEGSADTASKSKSVVQYYSHVITTASAPCLSFMNLRNAGLNLAQREAIRTLQYDNAVKVGIKFKRRWWVKDLNITAGSSVTDRPIRTVIYPVQSGNSRVITASFCYGQDAASLGGLVCGSDPTDQPAVLDIVIADLAVMHNYNEKELHRLVESYYVQDWNRDPNILGHFAFLGPGQFSSFFGQIQRPGAEGHLFIAGEMTSVFAGWIVAALSSAYRAVRQMLMSELVRVHKNKKKRNYIWSLIKELKREYGRKAMGEPKSEYDFKHEGIGGWQVILGLLGDKGDTV